MVAYMIPKMFGYFPNGGNIPIITQVQANNSEYLIGVQKLKSSIAVHHSAIRDRQSNDRWNVECCRFMRFITKSVFLAVFLSKFFVHI